MIPRNIMVQSFFYIPAHYGDLRCRRAKHNRIKRLDVRPGIQIQIRHAPGIFLRLHLVQIDDGNRQKYQSDVRFADIRIYVLVYRTHKVELSLRITDKTIHRLASGLQIPEASLSASYKIPALRHRYT